MSAQLRGTLSVFSGVYRGDVKWDLNNLCLDQNPVLESKKFQIAGHKWKIGMARDREHSDTLWIDFISCNPLRLSAYVSFNITSDTGESIETSWELLKACPFHWLAKRQISMKDLTSSDQSFFSGNLSVTFDLKDIQSIPVSERWDAQEDLRTVWMEVLDRSSINEWLFTGARGIASPQRNRRCDLCACSLVRFWATNSPDCRYWLCERIGNGNVVVNGCLNNAELFESFGDICYDDGEGHMWVTVFKESKSSNEDFQPIDPDTNLIFCKLQEPDFSDPSYHRHLLVSKHIRCCQLAAQIAASMNLNPFRANFKVEVELQNQHSVDITHEQSSLDEFGVHSGSCLVLSLLEGGASNDHRFIPHAPLAPQQGDADGDAHGTGGTGSGLRSLVSSLRRLPRNPRRVFKEFVKKLFNWES